MKNILTNFFIVMLLPVSPRLPLSPTEQGFCAYEIAPFHITSNVNLAIPFTSNKATTLTYSYQVVNVKSHIIYSSGTTEQKLFADTLYYIPYSAKVGVTSVGENYLLIRWRTTETATDAYHFAYFYGYEGDRVINLNSEGEVGNFLNEETTYRFSGFPENVGEKVKTTLSAPVLSGNAYFVHDLYFDFSALEFTTNRRYGTRLYESATLYTKDLTIFPRLSKRDGETVIPLKLSEEEGKIVFFPNFSIYVDEETYVVTQFAYPGYIVSKRLYFPKTKMGSLNLTKFRLEIKGYGYLKVTLNLDFYLEVGATFLGQGGIHEAQIARY